MRTVAVLLAVLGAAEVVVLADGPAQTQAVAPDHFDTVFFGARRPLFFRIHVEVDGRPLGEVWLAQAQDSFSEFDRDGSGGLNAAEVGKVPWIGDAEKKRMVNQRDDVAPSEFIELAKRLNPVLRVVRTTTEGAQHPLFSYLDADGDARLALDQLDELWSALRKIDLSDDEAISAAELQRILGLPGDERFVGGVLVGVLSAVPPAPQDDAVQLVNLTHATDGPEFYTREMIQLSPAEFDRADADGDGQLAAGELAAHRAQSPPDVELRIRFGQRQSSQPSVEMVPAARQDAPGATAAVAADGSLVVELEGSRFEFSVVDRMAAQNSAFFQAQFDRADTDKNEYLDAAEVGEIPFFQRAFATMDADGDEKLFADELKRWLDQQSAAAASRSEVRLSRQGQALFNLLDGNSDGRLTARELKRRAAEAHACDLDRDGKLTINEVPARFSLEFQRGQLAGGPIPIAGTRSMAVAPTVEAGPAAGPTWFRRMDRNRDGDVSRREFVGPLELFEKFDADGDDLIDADEAARLETR